MFEVSTENLSRLTIASREQNEVMAQEINRLQSAIAGRSMHDADPLASPYSGEANLAPAYLEGSDVAYPDVEELQHSLRMDQESWAANQPPDLTGAEKNKVYKYWKEMSAKYAEGMLSHDQMKDANSTNVQMFMDHQDKWGRVGVALRQAGRILNPDQDFNLDALRPIQPNYRNMGAWYAHYDNIKWGEEAEVEQQRRNLDDSTFMQFLVLQAKGTDSSVIKAKLGMGEVLYQACLLRLQNEEAEIEGESPVAAQETETEGAEPGAEFDLTPQAPVEASAHDPNQQYGSLTELEREAFNAFSRDVTPVLQARQTFTPQDIREALNVPPKVAMALLRALAKVDVLQYDKEAKHYVPYRAEAAVVA